MAAGTATFIPTKNANFTKGLFESFNNFAEYIVEKDKKTKKYQEQYEEYWEISTKWQEENNDLFEQIAKSQTDPPAVKQMKSKLLKAYFKTFVSNKFFQKVGTFLKNMWKKLSTTGTDLFFKILKFLLIMAIIDPKGKLFTSLLKIFIDLFTWLLKMIGKILPVLVSRMVNLVTKVIPDILKEIMPKLLKAFSLMFSLLGKGFRKTNPMLAKLFYKIGQFLESGMLLKVLNSLADLFPIFVGLLGLIAGITKLMPVIRVLWPIITKLFGFLTGTVGSSLALIVGYLVAVWVFAEDIVKFFETSFTMVMGWFKKYWKIILGALAPITIFVTMLVQLYGVLVGFTYVLAKLFTFIKKHGLKKGFAKFGKFVLDWAMGILTRVGDFFKRMWDIATGPFKLLMGVGKKGLEIGKVVLQILKKNVWEGFVLKWAIKIKNGIMDTFYRVKDFLFRFIIVGKNFLKFFPLLVLESVKKALPMISGDPKKVERAMQKAVATETQVYLKKEHKSASKERQKEIKKEAAVLQETTGVKSKIPVSSVEIKKGKIINKKQKSGAYKQKSGRN
jgi:hypothetical protein